MKIIYLPITCFFLFSAQSSIADDCKCDIDKEVCINMKVAGQGKDAIVIIASTYTETVTSGKKSETLKHDKIEQGIESKMCKWTYIDVPAGANLTYQRQNWIATFSINNNNYKCTVPTISLSSKSSPQASVTFDPKVGTASNNEGNITAACQKV